MVEKVITSPPNVVDFARYQAGRNAAGKAGAISARICRHCGAALCEGEREDECSSVLNVEADSALRPRANRTRIDRVLSASSPGAKLAT
jgi:hypothetical protein